MGASVEAHLMPVAVSTLVASEALDFRLYLWPEEAGPARLYKDRQIPLSEQDLQTLVRRGIHVLHVLQDDIATYRDAVKREILENHELPLAQRFVMLRDSARAMLIECFRHHGRRELAEATASVADQVATVVCDARAVVCDLVEVIQYDYSQFTHAINTCTYAVLLASQLGMSSKENLGALAQGALLHDTGKRQPGQPPPSSNPSRRETTAIDTEHPVRGFRKFASGKELSEEPLMMIYQHHERCDGRGFPVGLVRREIHPWSRICAIANRTDNVIRVLRAQENSSWKRAVEFFESQAGTALDEDMVKCWIPHLKIARRSPQTVS